MLTFFRQLRQRLLSENRLGRYLLYAIGEIVLVVIGILIALQLNNWKESRVALAEEITLLQNIREDILLDTIDIRFNLNYHKKFQKAEQDLLDYLLGKGNSPGHINATDALGIKLWTALHRSTFDNLQNNDVGLLQNTVLRKHIARFYDFYYNALAKMHNQLPAFELYEKKLPYFRRYFSVVADSTDYVLKIQGTDDYFDHDLYKNAIELSDADGARADREFIFILNECSLFRKALIDFNQTVLIEARKLTREIDKELKFLKD